MFDSPEDSRKKTPGETLTIVLTWGITLSVAIVAWRAIVYWIAGV